MLLKKPEELSEELELKVQVGSAVPPIIVDHSESVVSAYQQNICATDKRKIVRERKRRALGATEWARKNDARFQAGRDLKRKIRRSCQLEG